MDTAKAIADFAVAQGINAVLAPTHLIEDASAAWRAIDLRMCEALRHELDRAGGRTIAIDYQLITTNALLRDERGRRSLIAGLSELPIQSVWLRVSGFGASATGAGTRHFIEAVRGLHEIEYSLIADNAGGFSGLAAAAFGAVGGICHGVSQKENFRASDWKRRSGGGGSGPRVYLPDLDRHFDADQMAAIFAARGGRSRFGCNDTTCCPHGIEDMIEGAHAHFVTQRSRQIEDLSSVADLRRPEHFLLRHLDPAIRSARLGARLKIADDKVATAVKEAKTRLIRLRDALADLHSKDGAVRRSRSPVFRGGITQAGAASGR